jgi:transposase
MTIKKFRDNGYDFKERMMKPPKVTEEMKTFLLDRETLIKWQHHSLKDRCRLIKFKFGVKLCIFTLWLLY